MGDPLRFRGHLQALDGLRGIAAALVVLLHFTLFVPANPVESFFSRGMGTGWMGVDLFFVLSGFLITGILYDSRESPAYFRNFYARRSLRIFPLYYAYLFAIFTVLPRVQGGAVAGPAEESARIWIWTYLSNALFARGGWEAMPGHTTHLWSLAVEEQFYLLWPLVVFFVPARHLLKVCIGAVALAWAARLGLYAVAPDGIAGYALLPARIDALAIGGGLAVLIRERDGARTALRLVRPVIWGSAAVLGAVSMYGAWAYPADSFLPPLKLPVQLLAYPAAALLAAALVIRAIGAPGGSLVQRGLCSRPLVALGRYSYAIYLFHVPLRNLVRDNLLVRWGGLPSVLGSQVPAQIGLYVLAFAASTAAALVSWHAFEKHFIHLKRFFVDEPMRVPRIAEQPAGVRIAASHVGSP